MQANARGVDLNRNFDALWENIDTTQAPSFMNYRGEAPESEPETQALVAYTDRYAFDATLSYHATGSAIYWEFGEDPAVNAASMHLAEAIKEVSAYEPLGDSGDSFGGYKDWAMLQRKIPSVTIEVGTRTGAPDGGGVFQRILPEPGCAACGGRMGAEQVKQKLLFEKSLDFGRREAYNS